MGVNTYSVAKDGQKQVSKNFKVREFACKDGNDQVLIDQDLVAGLQKIRDYFAKETIINSAYRTASHNQRVGGSSKSQHLLGKAADIRIEGVAPLLIAQYAEFLAMGGVGLYSTFVHVDSREGKVRWDQRSGTQKAVNTFGGQDKFAVQSADYQAVQSRFGFDDNTMAYLSQYKFAEALLQKLATKA